MELSRPARFWRALPQPAFVIQGLIDSTEWPRPRFSLAILEGAPRPVPLSFSSFSARSISLICTAAYFLLPSGAPDPDGSVAAGSILGRFDARPAGCLPVSLARCRFAGGDSPSHASRSFSQSGNSLSDGTILERFSGGPAGCLPLPPSFAGGVSPSDASRSSSLSEN